MSRRHRPRNPLKPTVLYRPRKGAIPGFHTLPLADYEQMVGKRVDDFQRVEGGTVEYVVEKSGHIRFLRVQESHPRYHTSGHKSQS